MSEVANTADYLVTQKLVKRFDEAVAVDEVSLSIAKGEIFALLGPNGAGKTTTFYMVVGLIPATHGRVFLDGRNVTGMPMWQRARNGVGYLPQEASIFRKLTVWENVMAVVETLDLNERERRDRTAQQLTELGLEKLARQPAFTLSGGERRRLARYPVERRLPFQEVCFRHVGENLLDDERQRPVEHMGDARIDAGEDVDQRSTKDWCLQA